MTRNILEELQRKKTNLASLTKKATDFGWINEDRQKEILDKLDSDVLTIGVIGQMKCGKSTFLNSFVFEDDVLPAATTPMTATLSVITYGKEKKIVAEFYSKDEWEEQKMMASHSLEEGNGNNSDELKIKAAKELVKKADELGSDIDSYLGKTKEDDFENLIDYVGADGKYISIAKAVTIYYPKEYLKGVEIVDTPGFNDPIVSREERTNAFLKRADVVLMMLYAGRPFDATDRSILFHNVKQCGIGKVIICINKYDIPYENGERIAEIKNYVKEEIKKACKACDDNILVEIVEQSEPILLSAEMALLSVLKMEKITSSEKFNFAWKRAAENFEISSQIQMREKSFIDDVSANVMRMVETEKGEILFVKPLNAILAAGNTKKIDIDKKIHEGESLINNLSIPDDELEEKQKKTTRARSRLNKKIDSLGHEIDSEFHNIIRKGEFQLEDDMDATFKKMRAIIEKWKYTSSISEITPKLDEEWQKLVTRTWKRSVVELSNEAKKMVKKAIDDFLNDAEEILRKNLPDFDSIDFMKTMNRNIQFEIKNQEVFTVQYSTEEESFGLGDFVYSFLNGTLNGATLGGFNKVGNIIQHKDRQKELNDEINSLSATFDPKPYLESIKSYKDDTINLVKKEFITELIDPMLEQIRKIQSQVGEKETRLKEAKTNLDALRREESIINNQIEEINRHKY